GKPCRRSITSSSPSTSKKSSISQSANANPNEEYFCWQHKDQAADVVVLERTSSQKERRLLGKTSLDTLVEVVIGSATATEDGKMGTVTMTRQSAIGLNSSMIVRKTSLVLRENGNGKRKSDKPVPNG